MSSRPRVSAPAREGVGTLSGAGAGRGSGGAGPGVCRGSPPRLPSILPTRPEPRVTLKGASRASLILGAGLSATSYACASGGPHRRRPQDRETSILERASRPRL